MKKDRRTIRFDIRDPEQVRIYKEALAARQAWGSKGYELDVPELARLAADDKAKNDAALHWLRGRSVLLGENHPHGCKCPECAALFKLHREIPGFFGHLKEWARQL